MLKLYRSLFAAALLCSAVMFAQPARALDISLDGNIIGSCGTATATAGAATLANKCGVITSEALTTASGSEYTLTLTNTVVAAADLIFASVSQGSNTRPDVTVTLVAAAAGSMTIKVKNGTTAASLGGAAALNGTIKINYWIFKP